MTAGELRPATKLGGFFLALVAAVALGFAAGSAAGPIDVGGDQSDDPPANVWEHQRGH